MNIKYTGNFGRKNGDFLCDRTTMWGNPFRIGIFTRDECINLYEDYFVKKLKSKICVLATANRLGCHCSPQRCHCEIIKKYLIEYLDSVDKQLTLDMKPAWYYRKADKKAWE